MKRAPIRVATRAGLTGLVVLVVGAVVPNAAVGQVRGDAARNCEDVVFAPNTEDAAFEVRTTSVSCATTRKIIGAVRRDDALRPRGFSCRYRIDSSQAMVFTRYTCTKGRAAVRWLYGGVGSPLSARCSGFRVSGTRITHVRAYTTILASVGSEAEARRIQTQASGRGLDAGILLSSSYQSLRPGYWVVFSGTSSDKSDADRRSTRAKSLGYASAYPRFVSE